MFLFPLSGAYDYYYGKKRREKKPPSLRVAMAKKGGARIDAARATVSCYERFREIVVIRAESDRSYVMINCFFFL